MFKEDVVYHRVPITAETTPEINDFEHLLRIVTLSDYHSCAYVLNCQMVIYFIKQGNWKKYDWFSYCNINSLLD